MASSYNSKKPISRNNVALLPVNQTYLKQPNTLTFARYDFTVWQIKGMIVVIEELQDIINDVISNRTLPNQMSLFTQDDYFQEVADVKKPATIKRDVIQLKIPLKNFGVKNSHYAKLRESLAAISVIPVELSMRNEQGEYFTKFSSLFEAICPEPQTYEKDGKIIKGRNNYVYIQIEKSVINSLLQIDRGYTRYMKEIAMNQSSKYTIRIYLWISSKKNYGGCKISYKKFQDMLGIEKDEYKAYSDFHKRVIRPAYEALHESADCWFEVKEEYSSKSKSTPSFLVFKIITAVTTVLDGEVLDTQKKAIYEMLERHFGLESNAIYEIVSYVNKENFTNVALHFQQVKEYIDTHRSEIKDIPGYAYTSLMNYFTREE